MRLLKVAPLIGGVLLASPASAQDVGALREQLAAMQAEMARLSQEVAELEAKQQAEPVAIEPTPSSASPPPVSVSWEGAPEIAGPDGFSFKPRGRLQIDSAVVEAPDAVSAADGLGHATEIRRAYLGVDGTLPGGVGYRVEADLAASEVELTDVYLSYKASPQLTLTVGQHKPFWGLEEMTSDLFTSMLERAAFSSAFGFERRVGVSGAYSGDNVVVQLGVFSDNAADLNSDSNDSYSLDGRVVFSPQVGPGTLHLGASAHYRELGDAATTVRYRARPFVHTTDVRLIDTRAFSATGERHFGAELAYISGPFHATAEAHRMTAVRPGQSDPSFWGGYAEVGLLLTPGDKTGYRRGAYDRIRPVNPLSAGGIGAIQVNARYDRLDLTDSPIAGGQQDAAGLSLIWVPADYVRFLVNYGHLWITDAALPAGTVGAYEVDSFGVRGQIDF